MRNKIYRNILILCFIFSQGNGTLEEKIVRTKRLTLSTPGENHLATIPQVPYIVSILENGVPICGGSILSEHIIITAAHCVDDHNVMYTIISGTNNVGHAHGGELHRVVKKLLHPGYRENQAYDDIALLLINPPIDFRRSPNRKISLHPGNLLLPYTFGIVSGWGGDHERQDEHGYYEELRSMEMLISERDQCQRLYSGIYNITDKFICALDLDDHQRCEPGDSGAPFVIHGALAGVLSSIGDRNIAPDLFNNVAHHEYKHWIDFHLRDNLTNPHLYQPRQVCKRNKRGFFCFRSNN